MRGYEHAQGRRCGRGRRTITYATPANEIHVYDGFVNGTSSPFITIAVVMAQGPAVDLENTPDAFLVDQNGERLNAFLHLAWR